MKQKKNKPLKIHYTYIKDDERLKQALEFLSDDIRERFEELVKLKSKTDN